ncbi:MAG TPA: autotransporter-associated beta strand repeat-containing protein [Chthoniobacteraceae bacterium]|jgi:autotransporter-associated beta strand protein
MHTSKISLQIVGTKTQPLGKRWNAASTRLSLAFAASALLAHSASGATLYWDGAPAAGWELPANWSTADGSTTPDPLTVPGLADDAVFNISTANVATIVNLNANQAANSLTFRSTAIADLRGGGTDRQLTLGAGGITINPSGAVNVGIVNIGSATAGQNVNLLINASQTWRNNDGDALQIRNAVTGSATVGNTQTITIGETLAGATGGVNFSGALSDGAAGGKLALVLSNTTTVGSTAGVGLNALSTYSGGTTVTRGRVNANIATTSGIGSALGSGPVTITGDTVNGGQVLLSAAGMYLNDFSLSGTGTSENVNFGALRIGNIQTIGSSANTLTLAGNTMIGSNGGVRGTIASKITGAGNLSLNSANANGLVAFANAANDYTGSLTLNGNAILNVREAGALGLATNAINMSGGILQIERNSITGFGAHAVTFTAATTAQFEILSPTNTFTINQALNQTTGGLTKLGPGTLTLNLDNTYTGTTTIGGGTLQVGNGTTGSLNGTAGTALTFNNRGGKIIFSEAAGSNQGMGALTFAAGDNVVQSNYGGSGNTTLTFASLAARSAGATGNFVTSGGVNGTDHKVVLTGVAANSFVNQGTFFGGSNYAYNDATSFVRGINYAGDPGAVTSGGATTLAGTHVEITGPVTAQDTAAFTTLKVNGNHSLTLNTGATLTVNGILKAGNAAGVATISGGTGIQAASGAELVIRTDGANDALTINTPVLANGANALTKSGAGTLTLGGTGNTYTGATTVQGGTLAISGTVTAGAAVNVNNDSKLTLAGTYTTAANLNINHRSSFDLTGTIAGTATTGGVIVNPGPGETGIMNMSGSSSVTVGNNISGNAAFIVGNTAGGTAILNMTGGTMTTGAGRELHVARAGFGVANMSAGTVNDGGWMVVGITGGTGIMNINGGTLNLTGNSAMTLGGNSNNATGIVNVTSGSFSATFAGDAAGFVAGETGTGILNVSGSGLLNLGGANNSIGLRLGSATNAYAVANLGAIGAGGGTISTTRVARNNSLATALFNFHGGILQARPTPTTNFMSGLSAAYVYSEGGTIDNNGQNITIAQPLLAPTGLGVTGLATTGLPTTGFTTAPAVLISGGKGIGATAVANVDNAGNLTGFTITNPGTGYVSGDALVVTLIGGGYSVPSSTVSTATMAANASGGLTLTGTGATTLTGASTYTGATTVNGGGKLLVGAGLSGSLMSPVTVSAGTLGGNGSTTGAVVIGDGAGGSDSFIEPGNSVGTFTTPNTMNLLSDATYKFEIDSTAGTADKIVANGVSIASGALFTFTDLGNGSGITNQTFTIIDNTSASPITGTFTNLTEGQQFVSNGATYTASYIGGSGNDLVLTSVPEPGALVSLLGGLGCLLGFRRMRRQVR